MERSEGAKDKSTRENIKDASNLTSSYDIFSKGKDLNLLEEGDVLNDNLEVYSFSTSIETENSTIREENLMDYGETNEKPSVMGTAGTKIIDNTQYHYFESYGVYYYLRNDGVLGQIKNKVFHELGKGIAVFGGSESVWNTKEVDVIYLSCKEIIFCLVDEKTVYKYIPDGALFQIARNEEEYNYKLVNKQIENKLVAVEKKRKFDTDITPVQVDNIESGFKEKCSKELSTINKDFIDTNICEESKDIDGKMFFVVNRKLDENVEMEKGNFTLMDNKVESVDESCKPVCVGGASKPVEEASNISPKSSEDNLSSFISRSTKNKKSLSENILKYEISFPGLSIKDNFVDFFKKSLDRRPLEFSHCASARPTENISTHNVDPLAKPSSSECQARISKKVYSSKED